MDKLFQQYPVFEEGTYCKLHCTLTGHDIPATVESLEQYIKTKKFQTAYKVYELVQANPDIFEELDEGLIGCKITKTAIAKDPKDIQAHLNGKKFKRALERGVKADEDQGDEKIDDDSGASDVEAVPDEEEASEESEGESEESESEDDEEPPTKPEPVQKQTKKMLKKGAKPVAEPEMKDLTITKKKRAHPGGNIPRKKKKTN